MSKRYHCEFCGKFVDPPFKFITYEFGYLRIQYMLCDNCIELHKSKFDEFVRSIKKSQKNYKNIHLPESVENRLEQVNKEIQNKLQNNWNEGYQRWCDDSHHRDTRGRSKCNCDFFSYYCDELVQKGRPCVRALRKYLNKNNLKINYINTDFEKVWDRSYWK